jgi:ADP-ribosylglycohydrolase
MLDHIEKDSIMGCLIGQIVGDALGTTYEFQNARDAYNDVQDNKGYDNILDIVGGGPFNLKAGQITDDSELALGLLNVLLENKKYDNEQVAQKYIEWCHSNPFDIGTTTRNAFYNSKNYEDCVEKSTYLNKKVIRSSGADNSSNGCLMRISPLAIYGAIHNLSDDELSKLARQNCMMTNVGIICLEAVELYVLTTRCAFTTKDRLLLWKYARSRATNSNIIQALDDAYNKKRKVLSPKGNTYINTDVDSGYILHAFQNTFYELLHGTTFHKSLEDVVALGGDTDTNGCICGALLGAFYGIYSVPQKWLDTIMNIKVGYNYITKGNRFKEYSDAIPSVAIHNLAKTINWKAPIVNKGL